MNLKEQMVVPLTPEEALRRLEGQESLGGGILLTRGWTFYAPEEVDLSRQPVWQVVHVDRRSGELWLTPLGGTEERGLSVEDQVCLLANAARTLRRLGFRGGTLCHLDLRLADGADGVARISGVRGQLVDHTQPITLDELRGLNVSRDWAPWRSEAVDTVRESFAAHMVSEEEALQILRGQRPGQELALSTRGQCGVVALNNPLSPFGRNAHLALVQYAGGLQPVDVSLLIKIPVAGEPDTLTWRLRSVAQRLIAIGVSASARSMICVDQGESLLNPFQRIRDSRGRAFDSTRLYRLSHVRGFRDVEDLPSLKRPPEERIFDVLPVISGEYTLEQALLEAARCVECGLCRDVCPSGVGLVSYVDKLKLGLVTEAAVHLRELNPGVDMTCQVCPAPCQELCILAHEALPRRPVNIRGIEQVLAHQPVSADLGVQAPTGFKVALVGLGPANMVAAARLSRLRHRVHVFERNQEFGGAVSAIPSFRMRPTGMQRWARQLLEQAG